jgi:hypothetical protein
VNSATFVALPHEPTWRAMRSAAATVVSELQCVQARRPAREADERLHILAVLGKTTSRFLLKTLVDLGDREAPA